MGRALGFGTGAFSGARVAGKDGQTAMTYIPAHSRNGKAINQKITIPVYINTNKGTNQDGSPGRRHRFSLVAWGPLADACARSLSNGKAIDCIVRPESYMGRDFDANGNARLELDGSPVMINKVSFTITETPTFGEDSQKVIDQEIATGKRPINWNKANHPDAALWSTICRDRQAQQYQPGSALFGYARVTVPQGQGVVLTTPVATGPATKTTAVNPQYQQANPQPAGQISVNPAQLAALIAQLTTQGTTQAAKTATFNQEANQPSAENTVPF